MNGNDGVLQSQLATAALDSGPCTVTARQANEQWSQTAAVVVICQSVTAFVMGKLRLLDALIRRILPVH